MLPLDDARPSARPPTAPINAPAQTDPPVEMSTIEASRAVSANAMPNPIAPARASRRMCLRRLKPSPRAAPPIAPAMAPE